MDASGEDRWKGCHGDVYALADDVERERAVATIGVPADLSQRAALEAVPLWRDWQQSIATTLSQADSEADALSRLTAWADRHREDEDIAATLYAAAVQADLGGQLFVRTVEVPESMPGRALDARPTPPFLAMPFDEAVEAFMARGVMTPEQFRLLSDAARTRAFTATSLATDALRDRAYQLLTQTLRDGGTVQDFASALRAEEVSLGITPSDPQYLENVFRTNTGAAYSAGRYRQITSPIVAAARPLVEYRNPLDTRTSGICRTLAGMVFRQSDPGWGRFAPINHFQCRSSIVTRRESDVDPSRIIDSSAVPPSGQPQPGFDSPPVVTLT